MLILLPALAFGLAALAAGVACSKVEKVYIGHTLDAERHLTRRGTRA